jgi:hypothetical protein
MGADAVSAAGMAASPSGLRHVSSITGNGPSAGSTEAVGGCVGAGAPPVKRAGFPLVGWRSAALIGHLC